MNNAIALLKRMGLPEKLSLLQKQGKVNPITAVSARLGLTKGKQRYVLQKMWG